MRRLRLRLANGLTLSRLLLCVAFAFLFLTDDRAGGLMLPVLAVLIYATDLLDGYAARRFGSVTPAAVGSGLDSMTDNFVIITLSISLLAKGIMPAWLVLIVVWTRWLMTSVRFVSIMQGGSYAWPRPSTKIKGFVYAVSFILVTALYTLSPNYVALGQSLVMDIIIALIALTTAIAAIDFLSANRGTFAALLTYDRAKQVPDHSLECKN